MAILWMLMFCTFVLTFMARYHAVPTGMAPARVNPNKLYVLLAMAAFIIVSGLRRNIGDTFFYRFAYDTNDFHWAEVLGKPDMGFYAIQVILKSLSANSQGLVFFMAFFTNILIISVLYKYSRMLEVSLYVYIASGAFIVSMNGMRQYLAAAIAFSAIRFLIRGEWRKYMPIVLFASLFHQSALVLIPLYFVVRGRAWTKKTAIFLLAAIAIVAAFNQFSELLFSSIQGTQYGHYQDFQEGGANIIRVFVYGAPLAIAFLGRERLRELFPQSDVIVNMSLMGLILMIIATQNWIFARMAIYFDLYQLILAGWIIKLFVRKHQAIAYIGILGFYLMYFFFENVVILNLEYGSDYLTW